MKISKHIDRRWKRLSKFSHTINRAHLQTIVQAIIEEEMRNDTELKRRYEK